jgi:hypothetical protein
MSTLIKNIGILDARQATLEQIRALGRIVNVGCLVVNKETKAEFMKVGMLNVGKMLELDDSYKLHTGPLEITQQMLEDSQDGVKLCVVGPLTVEPNIPPELLQKKLCGLYLVGPASVPEPLYGIFMNCVKEIVGPVVSVPVSGIKTRGNITLTNDYLKGLKDASDISVSGNVTFAEDLDLELLKQKITTLRVAGAVKCSQEQETVMRTILADSDKTKIRIYRLDFHYVPGGTMLDTFTMLTINKQTISCYGLLILDEDLTEEIILQKDIRFEAGTLYFPKSMMQAMSTRLAPGTKGIPYEPGKLEVITCEQTITNARLEEMQDKSTLVVIGELEIDDEVRQETLSAKIATLDNYGEVTASKNIASVLQGKLRQNEGSMRIKGEDDEDLEDEGYDNVIANVATYIL